MCPGDILIKEAEIIRGGSHCQNVFFFKLRTLFAFVQLLKNGTFNV